MTRPHPASAPPAPRAHVMARLGQLAAATQHRLHPLIQLRWLAVFGQVLTILIVQWGLGIALPLRDMAAVIAGLVIFNCFSMLRWQDRDSISHAALFFSLLLDLLSLTLLLHLSGGGGNPFIFLYLLQVVLGAVLLKPWASWSLGLLATAGFVLQLLWPSPVTLPGDYRLAGLLLCFALNAGLVIFFITHINRMLREHDARLALLRQRATEEEHIVRIGLLASGAAHELSTPLATISVLLSDWRRLPLFRAQHDLQEEAAEMQRQLDRCKNIVSGILLSAGERRAEALERSRLRDFFDALAASWRHTRAMPQFIYRNHLSNHTTIVADEGLKQTICNVLDNAMEASPDSVELEVSRLHDDLVIRVLDRGPGFSAAMLAQFGRPYQSSKGRAGSGLGLFLSLNVARGLGGNIFPQNREEGGAVVTLVLPLSALAAEEAGHD